MKNNILNIKKNVIAEVLNKLSDIKFQKDVWINGKYWDRICCYNEAVNTLGDYNFFDDIENGIIKFTDAKYQKELKLLVKKLSEYYMPNFNEETLKSNEWKEIVEISRKLLNNIDSLIINK